jgi:hypothetical protein
LSVEVTLFENRQKRNRKSVLHVVGVQGVAWDYGGTNAADKYMSLCGNGDVDLFLGTGFFIHKGII